MITAIAMKEATIHSLVDKHFGKCACFFILNDENGISEIMENPGNTTKGCKAEVILNELIRKNVTRIIAGDFGSNVQQLMNRRHIQMIIHPDEHVTVSDLKTLLTIKS